MKRAVVVGMIFYCGCATAGQVAGRASQLDFKVSPHQACQNGDFLACNESISEELAFFQKGCQAGDQVKCSEYKGFVTDIKGERAPQVIEQNMFTKMPQ